MAFSAPKSTYSSAPWSFGTRQSIVRRSIHDKSKVDTLSRPSGAMSAPWKRQPHIFSPTQLSATTSAVATATGLLASSSSTAAVVPLNVALNRPLPIPLSLWGDSLPFSSTATSPASTLAWTLFRRATLLVVFYFMYRYLRVTYLASDNDDNTSGVLSSSLAAREAAMASAESAYENDAVDSLRLWLSNIAVSTLSMLNEAVSSVTSRRATRAKDESGDDTVEIVAPMPMNEMETGWGVCTLQSKRRFGRTSYMEYTFALPQFNYILPLLCGQPLTICGFGSSSSSSSGDDGNGGEMDSSTTAATPVYAEFYPWYREASITPGSFSILVPRHVASADTNDAVLAQVPTDLDNSKFPLDDFYRTNEARQAHVIQALSRGDIQVGDEVAIQPGRLRWNYRGAYHPVTQIVYLVVGTAGMVPVLDQLRTIFPVNDNEDPMDESSSPSTTVEAASVVWINPTIQDFDVMDDVLESELYERNSDRLAVSCIVLDKDDNENDNIDGSIAPHHVNGGVTLEWLSSNAEIVHAIPPFRPGTMAVVSGPSSAMKQCVVFLQDVKGFARDCICPL